MNQKVKHFIAINEAGTKVPVTEAIKQVVYKCPSCGAVMIPKQGNIKEWHYAHSAACTSGYYPETLAHFETKNKIAASDVDRMSAYVSQALGRIVFIKEMKTEGRIGAYVADVLAVTESGENIALEVVNTHYSTDKKLIDLQDNLIENTVADWIEVLNVLNDPYAVIPYERSHLDPHDEDNLEMSCWSDDPDLLSLLEDWIS